MVAKALNSSSVILGETNQRPMRIGGLTVGSCEFGDLALHGDDSLSFLYPKIECISPPPSCFPVKADTWSAYGLIADFEVLVTGPDDLTDEPLATLITSLKLGSGRRPSDSANSRTRSMLAQRK